MPKLIVTQVGFSASTWAANRFAPPLAVSPPMPALRNVRFHLGKRVVRYSSISLEYWYCSVMLSPKNMMRSFGRKTSSPCGSAAAAREHIAKHKTKPGSRRFMVDSSSWAGDAARPRRHHVSRGPAWEKDEAEASERSWTS